jgi:hypothetical protein
LCQLRPASYSIRTSTTGASRRRPASLRAGIIDPTKVVRTALQDPTEAMVAEKPETKAPRCQRVLASAAWTFDFRWAGRCCLRAQLQSPKGLALGATVFCGPGELHGGRLVRRIERRSGRRKLPRRTAKSIASGGRGRRSQMIPPAPIENGDDLSHAGDQRDLGFFSRQPAACEKTRRSSERHVPPIHLRSS